MNEGSAIDRVKAAVDLSRQGSWLRAIAPARHVVAVVLLVIAWKSLDVWYFRQHTLDYLVFFCAAAAAVLVGAIPFLTKVFREASPLRLAVAGVVIVVALPWGEWIGLSFPGSRLDWSRLLLLQYCCLYGFCLLLQLSPPVRDLGVSLSKGIEQLADRKVLWVPPVLFFCFTFWIAFFVYDQTPVIQDSAGHLFQAAIFSGGEWFAPSPPVHESFSFQGDMLILHEGRWFGMYLPGFAFLLSLAMKLRAEWVVGPLLGCLTVALWIEYARRWHDRKTALLTGVLCVVSPFLFMMSSTVMVHTPEIFLISSAIYVARRDLESPSIRFRFLLSLILLCSVATRGFSILVFLTLPLGFVAWKRARNGDFQWIGYVSGGLVLGFALVLLFQFKTTGNPWIGGYALEYDRPHTIGFGEQFAGLIHTPMKAFEQLSNNLLGLNHYLTGWYCGSLVFIFLFLLKPAMMETWDKLLLGSCCLLMFFYFFYVIQDLIFGPRFLYPVATILLLVVARVIARSDSIGHAGLLLAAFSVISFLPGRLPVFLSLHHPGMKQAGQLREEMCRHRGQRLLAFLDRHVAQDFINWNDPFLRNEIILCRDLGTAANAAVQQAFPDHASVYFRLASTLEKGKQKGGFSFLMGPDSNPPGYISMFEFASAVQSAAGLPVDFFDITYTDLLKWDNSRNQLQYLAKQDAARLGEHPYQMHFRKGVICMARLVILPKMSYEEHRDDWLDQLDYQAFLHEYESAVRHLRDSREAGSPILDQLTKVGVRIDRDQDGIFSNQEIRKFLFPKKQLLILA